LPNGFGECIIIELPDDKIGIIDCCTMDQHIDSCIPLEYLEKKGLDFEKVEFILITHFHQDHYRGISHLIKKCLSARVLVSKAVINLRFEFLIKYCANLPYRKNPFKEFQTICDSVAENKRKLISVKAGDVLITNSDYTISALSPSDDDLSYMDSVYKRHNDKISDSKNGATSYIPTGAKFNFQSVVLLLEYNSENYLFGADMEYGKKGTGLEPILANLINKNKTIAKFKLPHHGSNSSYDYDQYKRLTNEESIFTLTPYCKSRLPRQSAINNLLNHTKEIFGTSKCKDKILKLPAKQAEHFKDVGIDFELIDSKSFGEVIIENSNVSFTGTGHKY